jgi:hypothetical protein
MSPGAMVFKEASTGSGGWWMGENSMVEFNDVISLYLHLESHAHEYSWTRDIADLLLAQFSSPSTIKCFRQ